MFAKVQNHEHYSSFSWKIRLFTCPMHCPTQGQWWSNCSTQRSHVEQCFERTGLTICNEVRKSDSWDYQSRKGTIESLNWVLLTLQVIQSCDQLPERSAGFSNSIFSNGSWRNKCSWFRHQNLGLCYWLLKSGNASSWKNQSSIRR